MSDAAQQWQELCKAFDALNASIARAKTVNINSVHLRRRAKLVAQYYFRVIRPVVEGLGIEEQARALNAAFQSLIELAEGRNAATSYRRHLKTIRKVIPKITSQIEISQSVPGAVAEKPSSEDVNLIRVLEGLLPSAAMSYRQAIVDLADERRLSFRGSALELREALRETLDHLAPDDAVTKSDGYVQEKDRHGPTMKQKVRFILKARGQSKSSSQVPEQTASTVEEMVGTLTRSVYDLSSTAAHRASERRTVIQIKRYVVAILHDILHL